MGDYGGCHTRRGSTLAFAIFGNVTWATLGDAILQHHLPPRSSLRRRARTRRRVALLVGWGLLAIVLFPVFDCTAKCPSFALIPLFNLFPRYSELDDRPLRGLVDHLAYPLCGDDAIKSAMST